MIKGSGDARFPWSFAGASGFVRWYSTDGFRYNVHGPHIAEEVLPETPPADPAEAVTSDDYGALRAVLDDAFAQAANGKGAERHGNGQRFEDQPIFTIAAEEGPAFLTGQAKKKITEARGMVERRQFGAAEREYLGAIVYLAARIHVLRQEKGPGA